MANAGEAFDGVVVITGAAAGVGRAIALRFARAGAGVGLISPDEPALAELAREIRGTGGTRTIAAQDVSDAETVMRAAEAFERELGPIDVDQRCDADRILSGACDHACGVSGSDGSHESAVASGSSGKSAGNSSRNADTQAGSRPKIGMPASSTNVCASTT